MGKRRGGETDTAEELLESTLQSVDRAEALALGLAGRAGFAEEDLHRIATAVRECVVNAVAHGNQYSRHKKVRLSLLASADRLTVVVADQGEGFDIDELPNPLAEENLLRSSGRGLFLIHAFMDEVKVRRIQDGTEVTLIKYRVSK
ncbi:MAG: ATP-binding protein [Acidobacteria bacterium]|nr:ATP-binding protein [Acidobacteriota bacterium]